jgi:CRISPR-associated endonuclease/helicase Cas3
VRNCVETQRALETLATARGLRARLFSVDGVLAPHHSRYARGDRRRLDGAVEQIFGKDRASGVGRVLIATQTVEQSLDLDADLLLTDLCPMDVLLQRVGRLHRHERSRPAGFEQACVVVLVPEQRSLAGFLQRNGTPVGPHGYGTVYEDLRVLEATWRQCEREPAFEIPQHNRALVECATHPHALRALVDELGEPWTSHANLVLGGTLTKRRLAMSYCIDRKAEFDDNANGVRFPSAEEVGRATFGGPVQRLTVPHHLLRGAPVDPLASVRPHEDEGGGLRFAYGEAHYVYDRLGLRLAGDANPDREGHP